MATTATATHHHPPPAWLSRLTRSIQAQDRAVQKMQACMFLPVLPLDKDSPQAANHRKRKVREYLEYRYRRKLRKHQGERYSPSVSTDDSEGSFDYGHGRESQSRESAAYFSSREVPRPREHTMIATKRLYPNNTPWSVDEEFRHEEKKDDSYWMQDRRGPLSRLPRKISDLPAQPSLSKAPQPKKKKKKPTKSTKTTASNTKEKRPRGRPRKNKLPLAESNAAQSHSQDKGSTSTTQKDRVSTQPPAASAAERANKTTNDKTPTLATAIAVSEKEKTSATERANKTKDKTPTPPTATAVPEKERAPKQSPVPEVTESASIVTKKDKPRSSLVLADTATILQRLKDYYNHHGHLRVQEIESTQMYQWLSVQRYLHRLGILHSSKVETLDKYGMDWMETTFQLPDANLQSLLDFVRLHGHAHVPDPCLEFPNLPEWWETTLFTYKFELHKMSVEHAAVVAELMEYYGGASVGGGA